MIVSVLESWAKSLRDMTDSLLEAMAAALARRHVVEVLAVVLLLAVGVYSLFQGYDLWRLVNGDTIFPVHVQSFGALEYRPPPSNGLFPDVMVHLLVGPFLPDPLVQKLTVGWLLMAGSILFIGMHKGPLAALAVAALFSMSGFEYVDSTSHYSLPLMLMLYQAARPAWLKHVLLALIAFSDVLIIVPLIVLWLTEQDQPPLWQSLVIAALGSFAGEVLYSEFSLSLVQIAVVIPIFGLGALIANRFGLLRLMCVMFAMVLVVGAATGALSGRYAYPVTACLILIYLPSQSWRINWRYLALPAALFALFTATANSTQLDADMDQIDCLLGELQTRGIDTLATDHWMSKPVDMVARAKGQALTIAQVDFRDNATDTWMAPYDFAGAPTHYGLRNPRICSLLGNMAEYCQQDRVAPVVSVDTVCGGLELFTYADVVPANYVARPTSKMASIWNNFEHYLGKVIH